MSIFFFLTGHYNPQLFDELVVYINVSLKLQFIGIRTNGFLAMNRNTSQKVDSRIISRNSELWSNNEENN